MPSADTNTVLNIFIGVEIVFLSVMVFQWKSFFLYAQMKISCKYPYIQNKVISFTNH